MSYEMLLRLAFGLEHKRLLEPGKDPAGLAEAKFYNEDNTHLVKAASAYAMRIIYHHACTHKDLESRERKRIATYAARMAEIDNLREVGDHLADFIMTVVDRHYVPRDGRKSMTDFIREKETAAA